MKLHVYVYVLIILAYAANDVRLPNVLGEDEIMLTRCVGWVRGQLWLAVRNAALMACGPACILLLRFIFGRSWAVGSVYLLTFCSTSDGTGTLLLSGRGGGTHPDVKHVDIDA